MENTESDAQVVTPPRRLKRKRSLPQSNVAQVSKTTQRKISDIQAVHFCRWMLKKPFSFSLNPHMFEPCQPWTAENIAKFAGFDSEVCTDLRNKLLRNELILDVRVADQFEELGVNDYTNVSLKGFPILTNETYGDDTTGFLPRINSFPGKEDSPNGEIMYVYQTQYRSESMSADFDKYLDWGRPYIKTMVNPEQIDKTSYRQNKDRNLKHITYFAQYIEAHYSNTLIHDAPNLYNWMPPTYLGKNTATDSIKRQYLQDLYHGEDAVFYFPLQGLYQYQLFRELHKEFADYNSLKNNQAKFKLACPPNLHNTPLGQRMLGIARNGRPQRRYGPEKRAATQSTIPDVLGNYKGAHTTPQHELTPSSVISSENHNSRLLTELNETKRRLSLQQEQLQTSNDAKRIQAEIRRLELECTELRVQLTNPPR